MQLHLQFVSDVEMPQHLVLELLEPATGDDADLEPLQQAAEQCRHFRVDP